MEKICRTVGIVVLFVGILGSVTLAWYNESAIYLICGIFNVAIVSILLFAVGKILEQQEVLSNKIARVENKLVSIEGLQSNK